MVRKKFNIWLFIYLGFKMNLAYNKKKKSNIKRSPIVLSQHPHGQLIRDTLVPMLFDL